MLHDNLSINDAGHLVIGESDAVELAEKYSTPLYVLDEDKMRANCREYTRAFRDFFGGRSVPLYAGKALCCREVYRIIAEEGMSADVVSCGELYTAVSAGFPASKLYFHGNNKTDRDIAYAIECGLGCFVVDNFEELRAIDRIASERGITQRILLRLTPGIDPHTFAAVSTGILDCQFGVPIETGQAEKFVTEAIALKNIELMGYHCHIGSQVFEYTPFADAAGMMLAFAAEMREKHGYTASVINLGGGFGVRYVESDPYVDIYESIRSLAAHMKEKCAELSFPFPDVLMEPGRSIVANAGVTLYTAGGVKEIPGARNYVSIDGGMSDNPRYALYGSQYTVLSANKADKPYDYTCTVAGRCCESGALIQEHVKLPRPERGDILAVLVTGAYNYSMASNYNRLPRPAIVAVSGGRDRIAVRRETFEDVAACDV